MFSTCSGNLIVEVAAGAIWLDGPFSPGGR
jgi:hypothetical protein